MKIDILDIPIIMRKVIRIPFLKIILYHINTILLFENTFNICILIFNIIRILYILKLIKILIRRY